MISSFFKRSSVMSYLISIALLAVAVYSQGDTEGKLVLITVQKSVALFLLSVCMLAVDWTVKQRYWATEANYHLFLFPVFIFAFSVEIWGNWLLLYLIFLWIAFSYLVAIDQSGGIIKKVFNAFFFFYIGALFFPQGIIVLPLLWIVLTVKGALNVQSFFLSLVPIAALFLLEVCFVYFFPGSILIPSLDFSSLDFYFPMKEEMRHNLWWGVMLLLSLFAVLKHYVDMSTRSASYGSGIVSLFILTVMAFFFWVIFQTQTSFASVLFLMAITALSTRLFEEIKRGWIRELLFFIIIGLLFVGKERFFF